MRESGVRGILIYCADYHCRHSIAISADRWPDHVRLCHNSLDLRLLQGELRRGGRSAYGKIAPRPARWMALIRCADARRK
jgi:hypothetical protein